jgi:uncharacterized protein DUF998
MTAVTALRAAAADTAVTRSTRRLLLCGTVAGPLFVVVALVQAATRTGFDLKRHPFSLLSLGDLGYLQIANFVICGALFIACAVGLRRVMRGRPAGTWGPLLVALFGVGSIGGGVFVADPALGFPVGAAQGQPASISWHSTLHGAAFAVGVGSLVAAFFTLARGFSAAGDRRPASASVATGAAFVILAATGTLIGDWRFVALAVTIGWTWLAFVAAYYALGTPRHGPASRRIES